MAVLSMSKQEFSRLDVLLRVQSGRLRPADVCALMGLHRRQVFRLLVASSRMVLQACCRSDAASRAIIVFRLRFAPWHCPSYRLDEVGSIGRLEENSGFSTPG